MTALSAAFDRLRRERRAALIPFIVGGDPDVASIGPLLLALQDAGADVIEVGVPFSDPLADGPVIQAASARALAQGATPERILRAIGSVRGRLRVPVLCLTYWNPLVQFHANGARPAPSAFLRAAAASGVSGIIVPDLPVEEGDALRFAARTAGVATVFLAAPTSPAARLRAVARASQGFIYYVSVTGTTGTRQALPQDLRHGVRQLKLLTTKPVCVGFGISSPAQAAQVARLADGVIVGSALVRRIAQARGRSAAIRQAARFVRQLKQAMR